jgi:hypothetical protein
VLIIPKKLANRIGVIEGGDLKMVKFPCVGVEWLEASIEKGSCRYPVDYAYNYLAIKPRRREEEIMKLWVYKQKLMNNKLITHNS